MLYSCYRKYTYVYYKIIYTHSKMNYLSKDKLNVYILKFQLNQKVLANIFKRFILKIKYF